MRSLGQLLAYWWVKPGLGLMLADWQAELSPRVWLQDPGVPEPVSVPGWFLTQLDLGSGAS